MSCFSSYSSFPYLPPPIQNHHKLRSNPKPLKIHSSLSDPLILSIAEKLEDSLTPFQSNSLQNLRSISSQSLLSKPFPSPKSEPFRFTDISFLKLSLIQTPSNNNKTPSNSNPNSNSLTILNGHVIPSISNFPNGVFVGSVFSVPDGHPILSVVSAGGGLFFDGDIFSDMNGVGAPDLAVVYVPPGARAADEPVRLRICCSEGGEVGSGTLTVSNPRVLVLVEKGAEVAIVEEHFGVDEGVDKCYWANSVMEIFIGEGGKVSHTYVQRQSPNSAHIKWTFTRQVLLLYPKSVGIYCY